MKIMEYLRKNYLIGNKHGKKNMTKWQKRKARIARLWEVALKDTTFDE